MSKFLESGVQRARRSDRTESISEHDIAVLIPKNLSGQRRQVLKYLAASIPGSVTIDKYEPCKTLLTYGWGGERQQEAFELHQAKYACLDLGYWSRTGIANRNWRVSLNDWHCPQEIMKGERPNPSRLIASGIDPKKDGGDPAGPVLLVGNSPKSVKLASGTWAKKKSNELRRFTKRRILYKPKPQRQPESGVDSDKVVDGDIFDILPMCSLVVCRHSNVAVDACMMGVPVVCEDGAGAAIYPKHLKDSDRQPTYEERYDFLVRLSFFNWSTDEIRAGIFWNWLKGRLRED